MADTVDSMSNAELRTKLAEYGFPVMPVTASTRKLMAKKLKLLIDSKGKASNNTTSATDRRSLAKYSSGEESDGERKNEKSSRRRTTAGTAMPPPPTNKVRRPTPKKDLPPRKESEKGSESEEEQSSPVRTLEEVETVTTRRVTKTFQPSSDRGEYDTGSDSDIDGVKGDSNNFKTSSFQNDYISSLPSSTLRRSPITSAYLPSRPSLLSDYKTSPTTGATDTLNSIRSRLGLTSTVDRPSLGSNYSSTYTSSFKPATNTGSDEIESPYLSSFTRRLSAMKNAGSRNVKESDVTNGSSPFTRRLYKSRPNRPDTSYFKAVRERNILKNNVVSFTLVGIFCLFFLVIFFAYYGMKSDIATILEDRANIIPICQVNVAGHEEGVNCILNHQKSFAMDLLKHLHPELTVRAIAAECWNSKIPPYMDSDEVVRFISTKYGGMTREKIITDLYNLQVLVVNNPKWGIAVIDKENVYKKDFESRALRSMEEVLRYRMNHNTALLLLNPSLPISCIFLNKMYSILTYSLAFALISLVIYSAYRLRNYYYLLQKRKNDEIYSMVEQIIDILSQDTGGVGNDAYLPVTHVRDMLISPQNREKMANIWDAAVRFLEKNESRVRFEVQVVDGEEFRVFRWILPGGSPRRTGPSWQGQAFETQEGSVNSLSVSPTPCLKIRHMFDKEDSNANLRTIIQDAILEKCLGKPNILHLDIDKNTGCVYVKCASPQDAGIVYKNLHGWWYEGNLITVKYLKLNRYMERFPHSPDVGPYLKPSGRKSTL